MVDKTAAFAVDVYVDTVGLGTELVDMLDSLEEEELGLVGRVAVACWNTKDL